MKWNEYFLKRKQLKRFQLGLGIGIGFLTLQTTSFYILTRKEFNPTKLILGMDPSIVFLLGIGCSGIGGYVLGSLISYPIFRLFNRSVISKFDHKDVEFNKRIVSHRPPLVRVSASENTRILDYFGERIDSVEGYKKWLRIQRNYKKTGKLPHRLFN
jgi:mitochondrial import inner membrane translocase subunit TIM23